MRKSMITTPYYSVILSCAILASCGKESTRFTRLSAEETGITFNNEIVQQDSFNIMQNEYMYNGGGVGVADLNQDGLQDLIFTGNKVTSRIYLNKGDLKFEDITRSFEGLSNTQWISGVAVVDINADTLPDVYFTSTMNKDSVLRKNQLWIHQGFDEKGMPRFREMADAYGITDRGYSMHSAFFDYDLDGDLDLYVLNNIVSKEIPTNFRPKINDGSAINNDRLYRNEGNGHFTDVSIPAGIVHEGYGLGIAVGDLNHDSYPDLYISNDYISNDILYLNQRDGTFRNIAKTHLSYQSRFSMGNDLADVNNDGYQDIITLDMFPEDYFRKKQTINGNSYVIYEHNWKYGYESQYVRNMLHVHNGVLNGELLPFSENGQLSGIYQSEWSWSALFADYDNDGDRDLMVTNGFPKDLTDKDFTNYKAQMYGYLLGDKEIIPRIPVVKVSNYAYENAGDGIFIKRTKEWGMEIPSFSNGAAFADLDNDGDLDYVVNNINDLAFVYRNNTCRAGTSAANYIKLDLQGQRPNTQAIGAKIELWASGTYQYYEHHLSRGYLSSVEPIIHFGIGEKQIIDSLKIVWPGSRHMTMLKSVQSNQLLRIDQSKADTFTANADLKPVPVLFWPDTGSLHFTHLQEDFNDFFQEQRIIQRKFSQIGPCMVKGDINGDGAEDLVIAGSATQPASVYVRTHDGFEPMSIPGLTDTRVCHEADIAVIDFDQDGDNDVIALAGGYGNDRQEEYQHVIFKKDKDSFSKEALPVPPFPASVIRPCDFDKDGDPDLFIAARVQKGNFPYADSSYLLINEGGQYPASRRIALHLGMVTDAVWSDVDGDGWQDLLAAREWNTLAFLQNKKGMTLEIAESQALSAIRGFWSCITAADLDGDGDDDYIAGNLGDNHRFTISDTYPMKLYAIDVDKNGVIDPIIFSFWKDRKGVMREYPVNYLDELAAQSPFFRKKFLSYTHFSYATVDSILDVSAIPAEKIFTVNTSASYVLWNDKGNMQWEKLPLAAQVSPVKKILVKDFNHDNHPDILIAGNDHSYDVSTGYYDANKGVLLLGNTDKTYKVLPSSQSGLVLNGQVESLLFFEGDTPMIVAGVNRGEVVVYRVASGIDH